MEEFYISHQPVGIDALQQVLNNKATVKLSEEATAAINRCRTYLDQRIKQGGAPIYGINTGFGSLCDTVIAPDQLARLQRNLVMSHACGTGDTIPSEIVRWMLLLKAIGLSKGHSGVNLITVQRLLDLLNYNLLPVVYDQGSLGASGDLAPLAHLSLPLIGEGQLWFEGKIKPTKEIFWSLGWEGIELQAKEGLALLNGTQFMSAYACHIVAQADELLAWAEAIAAMSVQAYDGRIEPFGESLNAIRKQSGQATVAANLRKVLSTSAMMHREKKHVQDPYSFRCIPQVLGASRDALDYVRDVVEREINAVTDNPTIFPDQDLIVSGGNFHGQPLALALDFAAIALAEVASIAERRTYKLIGGQRGLPPFLTPEPGLNSGFMIPQYTAASIVSQNKQLCTPASIDSIDSSNGQEDHVSMGANAATKALRVLNNLRRVLGIELLTAAQALDFRGLDGCAPATLELHTRFRKSVPLSESDEYLRPLIQKSIVFIQNSPPIG